MLRIFFAARDFPLGILMTFRQHTQSYVPNHMPTTKQAAVTLTISTQLHIINSFFIYFSRIVSYTEGARKNFEEKDIKKFEIFKLLIWIFKYSLKNPFLLNLQAAQLSKMWLWWRPLMRKNPHSFSSVPSAFHIMCISVAWFF